MPFQWNRTREDELPPELKGKTPQEIADLIKKATELEGQVTTLQADKTKLEGDVSNINTEFTNTKNRVAQLETALQTAPPKPKAPSEDPAGPISVFDDEDGAINSRIDARVGGLANITVNTATLTAKMYAQQQLQQASSTDPKFKDAPRIFRKFEGEIDKLVMAEPPAKRGEPTTWINAFIYIRGLHAPEMMESALKGDNSFFAEPAGSNAPPPPVKKDEVLSPEELRVAQRMRLTPEQFLKAKKGMTFSNQVD